MVKFPNLEAEMVRRDVSNKKIAETIGVCERTLRNKMIGRVSFTPSPPSSSTSSTPNPTGGFGTY